MEHQSGPLHGALWAKGHAMHSHSPVFAFQQATKDLDTHSEAQQIHILKLELYFALDRAEDLRTHTIALEQEVGSLRTEADAARQQLESAKVAHHRELQAVRDQVRSLEEQGDALEDLGRSLLDQVETDGDEDGVTPRRTRTAAVATT
jgi:chromosome segregation ATPase